MTGRPPAAKMASMKQRAAHSLGESFSVSWMRPSSMRGAMTMTGRRPQPLELAIICAAASSGQNSRCASFSPI